MTQRASLRGRGDDVEKGGGGEEEEEEEEATTTIQMTKRQLAMASLAVTMQTTTGATGMLREGKEAKADEILSNFWEQIDLPLDPGVILLDVAFTDEDAKHG